MGRKWCGRGVTSRPTDISSCRGHGVIIGTCDAARERETTVELSRLLNEAIEYLLEDSCRAGSLPIKGESQSIAEIVAAEISSAKRSQNITSIHTNTKGLVMLKISSDMAKQGMTPLRLIESVFRRIERTKQANSKYTCRLIPLAHVFFPNESELQCSLRKCLRTDFPDIALPPLVCRRHLALERERAKAVKRAQAADRKRKRHEAFLSAQGLTASGQEDYGDDPEAEAQAQAQAQAETETETETEAGIQNKRLRRYASETRDIDKGEQQEHVRENEDPDSSEPMAANALAIIGSKDEPPSAHPVRSYPTFSYTLSFAARNHDVITKGAALALVRENMPAIARVDCLKPEYVLTLEILKNTGGITLIPTRLFEELQGFNLRKFTALHVPIIAHE